MVTARARPGAYRRSHASPAARTVSSCGATSWRLPIASADQPIRFTQRTNCENGSLHLELVRVLVRQVDRRSPVRRRGRRPARSAAIRSIAAYAQRRRRRVARSSARSSFARQTSVYSSARAGNVAACDASASCSKIGQRSAPGSGIAASTTSAPSSVETGDPLLGGVRLGRSGSRHRLPAAGAEARP